ncbi:MAG: thermonuclease family protein [Campylobacterota bacterium]|nr:thermonuclease family protein [Campylobacterota bacterium]
MVGEISNVENTCKSRLKEYVQNHPEIFHFSSLQLKRYQQYHLDILNNQCIIYAKGRKSLSEILLENGLAVRDVKVKNIVFEYKFKRAELRARREKKGIYSDPILRSCVNVLK